MPTIITANELRAVLGVSSALYSDTILNDVIDTAENVVLPMLVRYSSPIRSVELRANQAIFTFDAIQVFNEGQSVVIANAGSPFNGTHTVLADGLSDTTFRVAITNADIAKRNLIPAGTATLSGASTYVGVPEVESAVLAVATEVFQSRSAVGGQIEGVDFQVTPFRLGRSLFNRVSGLLGRHIDQESIAL
jgi:hypothetical protein